MKRVIHWFRRDLRLADNAALHAARSGAAQVIPVFCLDDHILSRPDVGAPRVWFLLESLREIERKIAARNGRLVVLRGKPEEEIPRFAREAKAEAVFFNRDYEPYARRRDETVSARLEESGIQARCFSDLLLAEPESVLTADGRPYSVFTPFFRAWISLPKQEPLPEVQDFGGPFPAAGGGLPDSGDIGFALPPDFDPSVWRPGEDAARCRLDAFLETRAAAYDRQRDMPAVDGTSRLSPYLKFGNISIRQVYQKTGAFAKFVSELAWREFYFHVLWHWPEVEHSAWQPQKRHLEWDDDPERLEAWKKGMTGYPIVDAGMRQLLTEGWMHNRVRMIVASFLTKDLHINWQEGERHFMLRLVDGDLAPNNGGWQWAAGTGVDPRPIRIFNPWLQSRRYDPEGAYIRRWVPELSALPPERIHEPHLMAEDEQRRYGCIIGRDYPAPVVDHHVERQVAMERYRAVRQDTQTSLF
ncbi:MAG: deoxyribodipyrimidine photo-lyase [Armatimonadota bacterium]